MSTKWERTPRVSVDELPKASLPEQPIPEGTDADAAVRSCVAKLQGLRQEDLRANSHWRDLFALTNNFRTFNQSETIAAAWRDVGKTHHPSGFKFVEGSAHVAPPGPAALFVAGRFTFDIGGELPGVGSGAIGVVREGGEWKIWFFNTVLEEVTAFGNPDRVPEASSADVVTNGAQDEPVDVVVIGAGQSGLGTLGRLKALGVKGVALERNDAIGANWTGRYDNVKLHTGKYYATLPGDKTFHDDDLPYLLGSKELSEGFQRYASKFGLDVRTSTAVESARWDEAARVWTVYAKQDGHDWSIRGRHLVFAIGAVGQFPRVPEIPNREAFQGTAIHSVQYKYPAAWKGKKGVVVGTANTAHDVAEDMVEAGLSSVTMVQRSPTAILPYKYFKTLHQPRYNKDSDIEASDRAEWGLPFPVIGALSSVIFKNLYARDPEPFDSLNKVGFAAELPQILKIHERAGGHYLDVGCSQKIIDGKIKAKRGDIESFTPTGLRFADGSTLDADLVIFATGFNTNIREEMEKIVGPEVGRLLEDNNGWDKEAEVRGGWKRHGHPAIWHTSGDLDTSQSKPTMAYVPPALRKRAQASSPDDGPLGTTAGSRENLPPGMAPPNKSVAEPLFSHGDIHDHYWDPQNEGQGRTVSSWSTLNASAQEPDKLKYIVLFRDANPRWESHGVIFVKSKLHILPGGERFREEQLDEAGASPAGEPVKNEWGKGDSTHESGNLTGKACDLNDEVPSENPGVEETQVSDESHHSKEEHLENESKWNNEQGDLSPHVGKKQGSTKAIKTPDPDPEPPYSPDLSLYPLNPVAVFEQVSGSQGPRSRFRFAGYHRIASLEYLPPHSRELFQLLEQKWTKTDRRGRVRQAQRSAESWKGSLKHRWAVIQMEKDQEADEKLAPPEIEVRDRADGHGDGSSGKSVKELLAELRLKG